MKATSVLLASLLFPLASLTSAEGARPNVIVIMTDDQGYGDLGCHGNPILKTAGTTGGPRMRQSNRRLTRFNGEFFVEPSEDHPVTDAAIP